MNPIEMELDALRRENEEMRHLIRKLEEELSLEKSNNRELKELIIKLNMRYIMGY